MANTYYVATTGNNGNPGTFASPWLTIPYAHSQMATGDVCWVADGTYTAFLPLTKDGLTFQSTNPRGAITKGFDIEGNNNTVRGFKCSDITANAPIRTFGDDNLVEGNEIYSSLQDGIWFWGTRNIIRGNYIHDIYDSTLPQWPTYDEHVDGLQSFTWAPYVVDDIIIENNWINHNRPNGSNQMLILTHSSGTCRDVVIRNNVFITTDNSYMPVAFYGDAAITGVEIYNNTFHSPNGANNPIYLNNMSAGVYVANNVAIGYTGAMVYLDGTSVITGGNNTIAPPYGMVSVGSQDYHLLSSSALINTGVVIAGLTEDYDGFPRIGNPDRGAFEYQNEGWSNIAKIDGVAAASLSKIEGVAVASISKVNGVAV